MDARAVPLLRRAALAVLLAGAGLSFVGAQYPVDLALHHIGTVSAVALLVWIDARARLSGASFAATLAFLAVHTLGARYLYSFVPYDSWSESLVGTSITDAFGFHRNHYDRLVHFLYGALLALPLQELLVRRLGHGVRVAALATFVVIVATSALYELLEWGLAVLLAPDSAERYNGQQGDLWDAQKDMALAALGAIIVLPVLLRRCSREREPGRRSAPDSA